MAELLYGDRETYPLTLHISGRGMHWFTAPQSAQKSDCHHDPIQFLNHGYWHLILIQL